MARRAAAAAAAAGTLGLQLMAAKGPSQSSSAQPATCAASPASPQCTLIFYMYHVDANMMGRNAGKQYPHMLAKHYAGRLGLSGATLVLLGQVR